MYPANWILSCRSQPLQPPEGCSAVMESKKISSHSVTRSPDRASFHKPFQSAQPSAFVCSANAVRFTAGGGTTPVSKHREIQMLTQWLRSEWYEEKAPK